MLSAPSFAQSPCPGPACLDLLYGQYELRSLAPHLRIEYDGVAALRSETVESFVRFDGMGTAALSSRVDRWSQLRLDGASSIDESWVQEPDGSFPYELAADGSFFLPDMPDAHGFTTGGSALAIGIQRTEPNDPSMGLMLGLEVASGLTPGLLIGRYHLAGISVQLDTSLGQSLGTRGLTGDLVFDGVGTIIEGQLLRDGALLYTDTPATLYLQPELVDLTGAWYDLSPDGELVVVTATEWIEGKVSNSGDTILLFPEDASPEHNSRGLMLGAPATAGLDAPILEGSYNAVGMGMRLKGGDPGQVELLGIDMATQFTFEFDGQGSATADIVSDGRSLWLSTPPYLSAATTTDHLDGISYFVDPDGTLSLSHPSMSLGTGFVAPDGSFFVSVNPIDRGLEQVRQFVVGLRQPLAPRVNSDHIGLYALPGPAPAGVDGISVDVYASLEPGIQADAVDLNWHLGASEGFDAHF